MILFNTDSTNCYICLLAIRAMRALGVMNIIIKMNLQQVIKNQQLKKKLEARKEERIKKKLAARQREKVNLDFSHLKTGKMEKSKIIQKKVFKTEVQKARKIEVTIQENANPSTFVGESQQYLTILNRTKNYIKFDKNKLMEGCQAISAYASAHKEHQITVEITMESPIQCNETPVMLRLPHPNQGTRCIIVTQSPEGMEEKIMKDADIRLMALKQFAEKYKGQIQFKKQVNKKSTRIFCDFKLFCKSKLIKKLINQHVTVFPIDTKKVPFSLKQQIPGYHEYIRLLLQSEFFTTKSGSQHRLRLNNRDNCVELAENVQSLVWQAVARLIQKNKAKGNRLQSARLKSETSIPIDIYN